jgi:photosystem II stability/assembly factor-like uncharacterized protein
MAVLRSQARIARWLAGLVISVSLLGGSAPSAAGQSTPPPGFAAVQLVDSQHGWVAGAGGIWATADGGARWHQQVVAPAQHYQLAALDAQHVWATADGDLLRTRDGGHHWERAAVAQGTVRQLSAVAPETVYALVAASPTGLGDHLLATTDGGAHWRAGALPRPAQALCFESAARGWLSDGAAVWRTDDGGASWTVVWASPAAEAAAGPPGPGFTAALACTDNGVVWALFEVPGGMSQVGWALYRTADAGATWSPLAAAAQFFPQTGAPHTQGGWSRVGLAAVDQTTAYLIGVCSACCLPGERELGTVVLARSDATGADWEVLPPLPDLSGPAALATLPRASFAGSDHGWLVAAGAGSRLWATRDGGHTWEVRAP